VNSGTDAVYASRGIELLRLKKKYSENLYIVVVFQCEEYKSAVSGRL